MSTTAQEQQKGRSGKRNTPEQRRQDADFEALWTIEEAAAFLGLPTKTLYQWRYKECGPRSHRVGRHVRYFPDEVRAWVREQA